MSNNQAISSKNKILDSSVAESLLSAFQAGTSTAENDPLLEKAQIKTQQFDDLFFRDRIDLVRGVKGAGKTALYRVLFLLKDFALKESRILMTFGVEPQGDPLFKLYSKVFDKFDEQDFEVFWYGYFMYLGIQAILENATKLGLDQTALEELKQSFGTASQDLFDTQLTIAERITRWFKATEIRASIKVHTKPTGEVIYEPEVKCEPKGFATPELIQVESEAKEKLSEFVKKSGLRLWILLDRLDEVFLRRTETETRGLRALLRAYYRFSSEHVRVKLFLREDIFESLAADGFTALTHIGDRSSKVMSWTDGELLYLVTKRLAHMEEVASFFGFDPQQLEGNAEYQKNCFYSVFPQKIGKQATFEWLMASLKDGKEQVTPRDLIDLLNNARNEQLQILKMEKKEQRVLIDEKALKSALDVLSKDKRDKYLQAEFPHLRQDILIFRGGYSDYPERVLEEKLGASWRTKIEHLRSIGFMKFDGKRAIWKIPIIWRKGLDIRRGRAKLS